jgi:hypothetical protein
MHLYIISLLIRTYSGCQSTLESLISSPAATCLNLPGTLAIFSTVANSSWIPATNTWLSNFCAADPCTNDALNSTLSTAASGCSAELAELATFGVTTNEIIQDATTYFPIVKEAMCLREYVHAILPISQGPANQFFPVVQVNLMIFVQSQPLLLFKPHWEDSP